MKLFIFFALFALAFAQGPPPPQYQLHIPEKCEDVLAIKVCDRLKRTAAALKLKSEEVKTAVIEAYKQGKDTAEKIEKAVKDFLVSKVLNKKCEDLTTAENCQKLRKLAADLKVKAEKVSEFIVKQIAELKTKTCEDLLDADKCNKLRDLANKLKIKAEKFQEILVNAYIQAKANATDVIVETYKKIKEYVLSIRCEDVFNPNLCSTFRKFAEKTKVALPVIMETAYDLVVKGIAIGKGLVNKVFDIVDYFYDCEDIFDDTSCDRLRRWAAKLKVTAEKFEIVLRKYVRLFIEKGTSIYQTIKDFVKNNIICYFKRSCKTDDNTSYVADVAMEKRSIFGDWKEKILKVINNKFPNLEANVRKQLENLVAKSRSIWTFLKNLAVEIKNKAKSKYTEILKKLMMELTL